MALYIKEIGDRVVDEITRLASGLIASTTVSSDAITPTVQLRKRRAGRGREESLLMRINEGVTVVPLKPVPKGGTNDRDDIGYTFLVTLATGVLSDDIEDDWWIGTWEQAIRKRFHMKRVGDRDGGDNLVEWSNANYCEIGATVLTGNLPEWAELKDGLDYTVLRLTVFVRESR